MKVLQIINSLATGGAEKLILDTVPAYNKAGIQMDVLLLWNNRHPFVDKLLALNCCNVYVLTESANLKDIYSLSNVLKIKKYLTQYDIAHVHLFPSQYFAVFAGKLSSGTCKLIFTEHNTSNRRLSNPAFKTFDKYIYRAYAKIVAISEEIKDILVAHTKLPIQKFAVITNGVNLDAINEALPLNKADLHQSWPTSKLIVQVAGFRPQKDQATLIRAMSLLPEDIKLILVGDGVTRKNCEDLVIELGLQNRVLLLGVRMDIPQLIKTADVVVLSSNYEGISLACIEGMASGKPFIASDVPGLKDMVGGAGVLFPLGDHVQLANAIQKLLTDSDYYDSVVSACLERAGHFSLTKMINEHIKLYNELYKA